MKNNWQRKRLGEIGTIFNGDSINARVKKSKYSNIAEGLSYVATKDIDRDSHRIKYDNGIRIPLNETSFKIAHKNSVLICAEGGNAGRKIAYLREDVCFGNKLLAIETIKSVDSRFVYYWYLTSTFSKAFKSQVFGVIGGISIKNFKNLTIPIPFLPEQRRIVRVLDEVFEKVIKAKESAEKNLKNSRELFESYLQSVFVNPDKDWEEKKLGEICDFVRGPFGGSLKKSCFKPKGIAVYEQQHAIYDQFEKVRYFIDEIKFKEMQRFEVQTGDLIMSCSGTMGKVAIVPLNARRGIINQALLKLSPHKNLLAKFLKIWMGSFKFQDQLVKYTQGAAIKNVASVKVLKEIIVPLPTLSKQKHIIFKFNEFLLQIKNLERIYQQKLGDLEELKKSVLKKAFNGEL